MIRAFWAPCGLVAVLLLAGSLLAPFNHDEDQYYGAAHAVSWGRLYLDFIYLQTPLQPLLGNALANALAKVAPGNSLWLLRISQALIGAAVFALVLRENLKAEGRGHTALFSALLMVSSYSFLFASTLYRNDMLPTLLATVGIISLAREAQRLDGSGMKEGHWLGWVTGGLFLGLSASAKANFLLLAAAPLVWLLLIKAPPARRLGWSIAFAVGGIAGAAPTLVSLSLEPDKFVWQVVQFGSRAPLDWYSQVGLSDRLTLLGRLADSLLILLQGPALAALALVLLNRMWGSRDERRGGRLLLLDLFIVAGLIAAVLPNPAWRQYFVVLLPALFLRLPSVLQALPMRSRRAGSMLLIVSALVGLAAYAGHLAKSAKDPDRLILNRWRESAWIGEQLQMAGEGGLVASLSPHLVVDSGRFIHPRFSSGVFVYRWGGRERDSAIFRQGGVTPATLAAAFATCRPAAIVTGYEGGTGNSFRVDLEAPLRAFASAHAFRLLESPFGKARLYLNPQPRACSEPLPLAQRELRYKRPSE